MSRTSLAFLKVRSNNYVYLTIELKCSYSCQLCEGPGDGSAERRTPASLVHTWRAYLQVPANNHLKVLGGTPPLFLS